MQEPEYIVIDDPEPSQTDKARALMAMFADNLRKYGGTLGERIQQTARIVTAQRPFYESYRYKPHNGTQEMARRRRHMGLHLGMVKARPDILMTHEDGSRTALDSHGVPCRFYG